MLFAGAMIGLVEADNVFFFYVCWEVTSVTSYLLIGNDYEDPRARAAALQALLVTSAGGLAMLGGFAVLGAETGSYRLSGIVAAPTPTGAAVTVAIVLVLCGAFTKSAQYPFHSWLPGAMTASTPVSTYLHSATMVTAGVYLVARLAPAFASTDVWRPLVLTVGTVTFLAGALRALRQHDLKLMLAFGTVSQLGLMMLLFGAGTTSATTAGWALLVAHALYKAALFMVVGILEHQTGTRDLRELPALDRGWRWVKLIAAVSAASMAGLPIVAGFVAKEAAYDAYIDATFNGHWTVLVAVVVGSAVTVAYAFRFYWGAFVLPGRRVQAAGRAGAPVAPPAWQLTAPALCLAAGTLVLGVVPTVVDSLAAAAVRSIGVARSVPHLAVWHGWGGALGLTAVTLLGGTALVLADRSVQRALATGARLPTGERGFLRGAAWPHRHVPPSDRHRAERFLAGLCGRDPAHGRGAPVDDAHHLGRVAGPPRLHRSGRGRPDCGDAHRCGAGCGHGPAPVLRRPLPRCRRVRNGWSLRRVRRARPRTHAGRSRDALDRGLRPGAPLAPATVRTPVEPSTARGSLGNCRTGRRHGLRVRHQRRRQPDRACPSRTRWSSGRCPTGTGATWST